MITTYDYLSALALAADRAAQAAYAAYLDTLRAFLAGDATECAVNAAIDAYTVAEDAAERLAVAADDACVAAVGGAK
jgi:hypothetical protein